MQEHFLSIGSRELANGEKVITLNLGVLVGLNLIGILRQQMDAAHLRTQE